MTSILLRSRLRWYAVATGRLVLRRWQALLLALTVLAPASVPLLRQIESLGAPILVLLSPEHGALWRYAILCLYQAFAVIWVQMQRDQIGGGEFMRFAQSLPLQPRQVRTVDLLVLLAANSPLLLLLPAAAMTWLIVRDDALSLLLHSVFIAQLLALAAFAQLACLDRAYVRMAAIALANVPLAAASGAAPAVQVVLLAVTLPCAWIAARTLSAPSFRPLWGRMRHGALHLASRASPARLHPAALIPLNYLVRHAPAQSLGKLAVAAAISAAALWLMALWDYDDRSGGLAVITLAIVALVISGLYRPLQMAHRATLPLVAGLPLAPHWARKFDHAVLMLAAAPFAVVIGGAVMFHQPHRIGTVLLLCGAYLGLVGVLRLPQVHAERQAVVLGTVLAALWGTACALTLL
jgi:hypothetical protein